MTINPRSIVLLTGMLLLSLSGISQEVFICRSYSNTGVSKNIISEITVDSLPVQLKVLYNNGKTTIDRSKINMLIEFDDEKKLPAEPFYLNVSQGRNWVAADIEFKQEGHQVISAFTPENKILASCEFNVIVKGAAKPAEVKDPENATTQPKVKDVAKEENALAKEATKKTGTEEPRSMEAKPLETGFDPKKKVEISEEEAKTLHYDGVKLEFGQARSAKGLEGTNSSFSLDEGRADVTGLLLNQLPIKTSSLQVDIWQKGKDGSFSELTVSEEHDCNPKSYKTYFPLRFYREGDYKISIYTDDFVWITSGYLNITK